MNVDINRDIVVGFDRDGWPVNCQRERILPYYKGNAALSAFSYFEDMVKDIATGDPRYRLPVRYNIEERKW